ncbi:MAG: cytochrome P450 [Pseudomonadales bacterium]
MSNRADLEPIPRPHGQALIGNVLTIDRDAPLQSMMALTREQGPIFWLDMLGTPLVIVSGAELVRELCDETRFDKAVRGPLRRVRAIAGDGLFTADTQAPNWGKAHRLLMPTFSQRAMVDYLPMMTDIASQLCLKWQRLNANDDVDVVHDMTALALDTIGVCGFGYGFNSFYRQDFHPFIDALSRTLETSMVQRGLPFEGLTLRRRREQLERDAHYMNGLVDNIIRERRRAPQDDDGPQDLLGYMLSGVDKTTGERLSDENIRYQINTFLIAGHETTSGLLSFTLHFLLKHPEVLARAYEEVDRVVGRDVAAPDQRQLARLDYLRAILLESLRLWPTAPAFSLYPYADETIGGRYPLPANTFVTVLTLMLHRDPAVWGDDPESFDPERFSREAEATRPDWAYKPFGNGQRACIGRQFAMQEAILVLAMILQRFELVDQSDYQLVVKETLSIKPDGFTLRVRPRPGSQALASLGVPGARPEAAEDAAAGDAAESAPASARPAHGGRLYVAFGSNLGSTEAFAREIAQAGRLNGFDTQLAELNDFAGRLPTDGALVVACASYNGAPPDNAAGFVDWLGGAARDAAQGVRYTVLGCGNRDWASTYQATPRRIDEALEALGGERIRARGEADAREDQDSQFRQWFTGLWPDVGAALGLDVDFSTALDSEPLFRVERVDRVAVHPVASHTGAVPMTVTANRELQDTAASGRSTRHIEIALPDGVHYQPGDHLCVVGRNHEQTVRQAMDYFGFEDGDHVRITPTGGRRSPFPKDTAVSVRRLAEVYGELQNVASRKDVATLAAHTECPDTRAKLEALAAPAGNDGDAYRSEVLTRRLSVLDLLESFPAVALPFNVFLEMIPWMAPRYYSISSSPLAMPGQCSITLGVVSGPARSGRGVYHGTCSSHLAARQAGDAVYAVVRDNPGFHLPDDPATPLIMIGPGTGLAPFRGFLEHRARLRDGGAGLGDALLLFGCRHPEQDYLYRDELEAAAAAGLTELRVAFSRADGERAYVQDLLRQERDRVAALLQAGAIVYVCGDGGHMEPDVKRTLMRLHEETADVDTAAAEAWIDSLREQGRYRLDVWITA